MLGQDKGYVHFGADSTPRLRKVSHKTCFESKSIFLLPGRVLKPLFLSLASKTDFEIYVVWHCDSLVFESVNVNSGYSNIQGQIADIVNLDSSHYFSTWWQSSPLSSRLSML